MTSDIVPRLSTYDTAGWLGVEEKVYQWAQESPVDQRGKQNNRGLYVSETGWIWSLVTRPSNVRLSGRTTVSRSGSGYCSRQGPLTGASHRRVARLWWSATGQVTLEKWRGLSTDRMDWSRASQSFAAEFSCRFCVGTSYDRVWFVSKTREKPTPYTGAELQIRDANMLFRGIAVCSTVNGPDTTTR